MMDLVAEATSDNESDEYLYLRVGSFLIPFEMRLVMTCSSGCCLLSHIRNRCVDAPIVEVITSIGD